MTDPRYPDQTHPTPDELADLRGGALDPEHAEEVAAHVRECASCADEVAAIDDVKELLVSAGRDTPPMPREVAASLDAALARAAAERSSGVTSLDERRSSRRNTRSWLGGLGVAAAVLAFVIGGGVVLDGLDTGGSDDSDTTAGGAADRAAAQEDSGAGSSSMNEGGAGASPETAPQSVTKDDVANFARALVRQADKGVPSGADNEMRSGQNFQLAPCPATSLHGRSTLRVPIRFQNQIAYVRVNRETHEATVYSCDSPPERLYSTAY